MTREQQADSSADSEASAERERLGYVTRLLGGQQGLYTALFGTVLFFMSVEKSGIGPADGGLLPAWLPWIVGLGILLAAYKRWIPKYYQQRFGSVQALEPSAKWFGLFLLTLLVLLFIGQPLARYLDPRFSSFADRFHVMISDPAHQINLAPSFFWMAVFLSRLRWHMRRWERQESYFLIGGLVASSSIAIYGMLQPEARQLTIWKILNAGGFGLSLMVMGLFDHIALVRALPKRFAEDDDE